MSGPPPPGDGLGWMEWAARRARELRIARMSERIDVAAQVGLLLLLALLLALIAAL